MVRSEQCKFPDFETIVQKCKGKMIERFDELGNTWVENHDFDYWKSQLQDKLTRVWDSPSQEKMDSHIIDAFNLFAMLYMNTNQRFKKDGKLAL